LLTWQQIKKLSNQRSSRKKATWFHEIEDIILANTHTRKHVLWTLSATRVIVKARVRQEREVLIDISPWVKYAKGEMNLELEPEHFINRSEGSSILPEKVRSLQNKKEEIRVIIKEPKAWTKKKEEILDSIKEELKQKEKIDLGPNWLRE
ncbi:42555_t:CDS:2, partial [Gigaspora margarita]